MSEATERPGYPVPIVLGMASFGLLGVVANLVTLVKVARSFDRRRVCFFLAHVDTVASTVGYVVFTSSILVGNLVTRDRVACTLITMSLFFPYLYGVIITAQVSILRQD